MVGFKSSLATSVSLAVLFTTGAAAAQTQAPAQSAPQAQATEVDEIIVTGFRASLDKAIDDKRRSAEIIDSIQADDIASFPDLNLAEAIQRIPGVSITRDGGEGRQITVRGVGPEFTRVRINGLEGLATTGGTDNSGGANRTRSFDFNVFASDLFTNITVKKTASASVDEGSLGATVDLTTGRPFDYGDFTFAASAQAGYNDLSEATNPKYSGLISNTWFDGRFGALLSVSYTERDILEEGTSTAVYANSIPPGSPVLECANNRQGAGSTGSFGTGTSPGTDAAPTGGVASDAGVTAAQLNNGCVFHPRIPRYGVVNYHQERLGLTGSLQWKPTDRTVISLDALYSNFDGSRTEEYLESLSFARPSADGKGQVFVREGVIDANNNLSYALFDNVDIRSEARLDELTTEFSQLTLSAKHTFGSGVQIDGLLGYSESEFSNPVQATVSIDRANSDGYSWDYRDDDRLPLLNYGFDVTDVSNWSFEDGTSLIRLRQNFSTNTFKTAEVNLDWPVGDVWTLRAGAKLKSYEFNSREARRLANETQIPALPDGVTLADLTHVIPAIIDVDAPAGTPREFLAPDLGKFAELFDIFSDTGAFAIGGDEDPASRQSIRDIVEDDTSVYGQVDFDTLLFGMRMRGNAGVRWARTELTSSGYLTLAGAPSYVTVERTYDDTLPSLNLVFEPRDDVMVRFGASKTMSRPNLPSLTPGGSLSLGATGGTVVTGNPNLEPVRSENLDLAFEWYPQDGALVSVGLFYKKIDDFIQTFIEQKPFNESGLSPALLEGSGLTGAETFTFVTPINLPGGPLKGVEVNIQQPLTFLPGFLSDTGILLNYTWVDSEFEYLTSATNPAAPKLKGQLSGLSPESYNATLYYEGSRFSLRGSVAYRDEYLTTIPGSLNSPYNGVNGRLNFDVSASYALTPAIKLTFEGLNLTDTYSDVFTSEFDRPVAYQHTGRQFYLGARYTF